MPVELRDQRILLTGPTSQVALPIARALAPHNEVHGVARFRDPATRAPLEAIGVECIALDLAEGSGNRVVHPDQARNAIHPVERGILRIPDRAFSEHVSGRRNAPGGYVSGYLGHVGPCNAWD